MMIVSAYLDPPYRYSCPIPAALDEPPTSHMAYLCVMIHESDEIGCLRSLRNHGRGSGRGFVVGQSKVKGKV